MRENAGCFACALHASDDVEQIGVVALLLRRHAPGEALVAVAAAGFTQREAGGPALVREGWIGDHIVIGAQLLAVVEEARLHERALATGGDVGRGEVMQDHVHPRETSGGAVLFLAF